MRSREKEMRRENNRVSKMSCLREQQGFTLVEMIVAMFIFGILATGMTTLMGALIQNNDFARAMTEATTLGENKMEEFKNIPYASIPVGWDWDMPSTEFWRVWEVWENVPQAGMKQVTIMVIWFDSKHQFHTVSLITLKSA